MSADPWWAYPGDRLWQSQDGAIAAVARVSSETFVRIDIVMPNGTRGAVWDPNLAMLSLLEGPDIPKDVFQDLRDSIARAAEPRTLSPAAQFLVDALAAALGRPLPVTARSMRQQLIKEFSISREAAQTILNQVAPRFVRLQGDLVQLQPIGLLRAAGTQDVRTIAERALLCLVEAYDHNPDVTSLNPAEVFYKLEPAQRGEARSMVHTLALASESNPDGWSVPLDIEELWHEKITSLDALWKYSARARKVPRPWPGALIVQRDPDASAEKTSLRTRSTPATIEAAPADPDNKQYRLPRLEVNYGKKLGSGAFGTVWEATDALLQRSMAVKFLTATDESLDEEALLREVRSLAKVSHPNLVTAYGAAWLQHPMTGLVAPAIMMERIVGEPLEPWWSTQRDHDVVFRAAIELAAGVKAIHDAGLHHGDLHAENIVVGPDGHVKVIDWRYQDSFLQKPSVFQKGEVAADSRRTMDHILLLFEKQGLIEQAQQLRRIVDLNLAMAMLDVLRRPALAAEVSQPTSTTIPASTEVPPPPIRVGRAGALPNELTEYHGETIIWPITPSDLDATELASELDAFVGIEGGPVMRSMFRESGVQRPNGALQWNASHRPYDNVFHKWQLELRAGGVFAFRWASFTTHERILFRVEDLVDGVVFPIHVYELALAGAARSHGGQLPERVRVRLTVHGSGELVLHERGDLVVSPVDASPTSIPDWSATLEFEPLAGPGIAAKRLLNRALATFRVEQDNFTSTPATNAAIVHLNGAEFEARLQRTIKKARNSQ